MYQQNNWKDTPCIRGSNIRWWYQKKFGKLPSHIFILHHCDNGGCRNVNHIWLGTQADNMRDMMEKGRWRGREGMKSDDSTKQAIALSWEDRNRRENVLDR